MSVLVAIETLVIVLLTVLVAGLLRSHADILRRLHALDGGGESTPPNAAPLDLAPTRRGRGAIDIDGAGLHDDVVHIAIDGTGHRTLLAFLSSGCLTCREFWDAFADERALGLAADIRLVVVTKDPSEESLSAIRALAPPVIPVVMASDAWANYDVPGSPYFVLVDGATARVDGEGTGASWDHVRNLIGHATGDEREIRIDRELLAHGIAPGDPILYHDPAR
jgi:hypothetical protein